MAPSKTVGSKTFCAMPFTWLRQSIAYKVIGLLVFSAISLAVSPVSAQSRWQKQVEKAIIRQVKSIYLSRTPVKTAKKLSRPMIKPFRTVVSWNKNNQDLLEMYCEFSVAQGFAFYEEADPEQAAKYYAGAVSAAQDFLNRRSSLFTNSKLKFSTWYQSSPAKFRQSLKTFDKKYYPALFWYAFSLGLKANLQRETSQIVQVPKLKAIFQYLNQIDPSYFHAGSHLALGLLECILPKAAGRDLKLGRKHFEAVQRLTNGHWLLGNLIRAKTYSVALQSEFSDSSNRRLAAGKAWADYFQQLETVIGYDLDSRPDIRLYSKVCKQRAEELLKNAEDYIIPPAGTENPYEVDDDES